MTCNIEQCLVGFLFLFWKHFFQFPLSPLPPLSPCSAAKVLPPSLGKAGASTLCSCVPRGYICTTASLDKLQKPPCGLTRGVLGTCTRNQPGELGVCERQSTKPNVTCKSDLIEACNKEHGWSDNSFKEHGANQSMSRAGDKPGFGVCSFLALPSTREQDTASVGFRWCRTGVQHQEHK